MHRSPLLVACVVALAATAGACETTFLSLSSDGDIQVFIHTDGREPDGWRIRVDGGVEQAFPRGGSMMLADLREGAHLVELTGGPGGCRVMGSNPRRVLVGADGTTSVAFDVACGGLRPPTRP